MIKGSVSPIVAVLLLAACNRDAGQTPPPKSAPRDEAPVQAKRGPTPEELTAGMVEAVTVGKSTVPIALKFDLPQRPVMGQPLDIVVAVLPQVAGSANLQVTGSDGLQLAPGMNSIDIPSLEPTQAYRVTITTTPTGAGVQLLELNVVLTHDEATDNRTFSVPIIVSTDADAAAGPKTGSGSAGNAPKAPGAQVSAAANR